MTIDDEARQSNNAGTIPPRQPKTPPKVMAIIMVLAFAAAAILAIFGADL